MKSIIALLLFFLIAPVSGRASAGTASPATRVTALIQKALEADNARQFAQAIVFGQQAFGLAFQCKDLRGAERASRELGAVSFEMGLVKDALRDFRLAFAFAAKVSDGDLEAMDLGDIGVAYRNLGDGGDALMAEQLSLPLAVQHGDIATTEGDLTDIGASYLTLGQYRLALDDEQKALSLSRHYGDLRGERQDLCNIGIACDYLGYYGKAVSYERQALSLSVTGGDSATQEFALLNLAIDFADLGDSDAALDFTRRVFVYANKTKDIATIDRALCNLGVIDEGLGRFSDAMDSDRQSLDQAEKQGDEETEALDLGNMGVLYEIVGEFDRAMLYDQESLTIANKVGDQGQQERALTNLGNVYEDLGKTESALAFHQKALLQAKAIEYQKGEEQDLGQIGNCYEEMGRYAEALGEFQQSLAMASQVGDVAQQAAITANIGVIYHAQGNDGQALNYYQDSLPLERKGGDPCDFARTLSNIMFAEQDKGFVDLAIFYGKESIDRFQELRSRVYTMDPIAQKAFLSTADATYRDLADLLIGQGRLSEAQQVLSLLKEQDYFEYIHAGTEPEPGDQLEEIDQVEMTLHEQKWDQAFLAVGADLQQVMAQISADFAGPPSSSDELADRAQADDIARQLAPGSALIYTIVEPQRIRLIVVTPSSIGTRSTPVVASSSDISSEQLYKDVVEFRSALSNPDLDPRPLGATFYDLLIAPVKAALDAAGIHTLYFSLDDALRYLPVSALYNQSTGRYLVQDYCTATVTLVKSSHIAGVLANSAPSVLGLGTSAAHIVGSDSFPALPGVAIELVGIVREPGESTGLIPGRRLLDAGFSLGTMEQGLESNRYNMVHIASHFVIGTLDTTSYLLLGDGTPEYVSDLRLMPNIFAGVDLLTLSACDTGEDIQIKDGHEIDGFGALMQQLGAKSVIASLWPVSDAVTPTFMDAMYTYRRDNPQASTAEALQYAQIALLTGSNQVAASDVKRGPLERAAEMDTDDTGPASSQPTFTPDPATPYAHPFYWAPFVLIGEWK